MRQILTIKRLLIGLFFISIFQFSYSQTTLRCYFIGNSVTDAINLDGLKALAESKGNTHTWARQMIPGAPLEWLWQHPNDGFTTSPYGVPTNAFPNYTWDAISLQPFDRFMKDDSLIIGKYIDSLGLKTQSPNVQIYVYQRWPRTTQPTLVASTAAEFNTQWEQTYSDSWSGQMPETRDFFEKLTMAVRLHHPEMKKILMVPVGEVMYRLNKQMQIAPIDTFAKIWQVYSDGIHMNKVGNYIAACTYYATYYKADPRGLSVPAANFGTIPAVMVTAIQNTVWEVVTGYKDASANTWSGVTDGGSIAVTGVVLTPSSVSIAAGATSQLTATIAPANATNKNVYYSSTNSGVAQVSATGLVTGVSAGLAKIIVTTADANKKDTTDVTVTGGGGGGTVTGPLAEWDFAGNGATASVATAKYLAGISTVAPSLVASLGAGLDALNFTGNGLTVSNISSVTLAEAIAGNDYITFTITPEAGKTVSVDSVKIRPISQNANVRTFSLFSSVGGFAEANVIGSITGNADFNATIKKITVTGITGVATAIEFRVYIYGFNNVWEAAGIGNRAGGLTENDLIVYGSVSGGSTAVTGVSLDYQTMILNPGISSTLTASVLPVNATDKTVSWQSTTTSVATVDNAGKVTAVASGKTNVIVTTTDGSKKDTCAVRVNTKPVASFTATPSSGSAPLNVSFNCSASSDPDAADGDYILGFDWDFGDGSAHANSNAPTHTYNSAGTYTVSLRVMDNNDLYSDAVTKTVTVSAGGDTQAPTAPSTLTGSSGVTPNTVNLNWTASTDNVAVTWYLIFRNGVKIDSVATPAYTATGLTIGTAYAFTVKARDAAGNISAVSNTANITLKDTQAPTAPATLTASSGTTPNNFNLNWAASTDNVAVTWYLIYKDGVKIDSVTTPAYTATGLVNGTTYAFVIKARDAAGNISTASNTATVTIPTNDALAADNEMISIFPNPASDFITLALPAGITGTVVITNTAGIVVAEKTIQSDKMVIGIAGLPKGMYLIHIASVNNGLSGSFLIE